MASSSKPTKWAQDQLVPPVRGSTTHQDARLARYRRAYFSYVFDYEVAPNAAPQSYFYTANIAQSNDWWLTQIVCSFQDEDTQAFVDAPGQRFITVADSINNYTIVDDLWIGAFYQTEAPDITLSGVYAARTVWPCPYGFGAGGTISVTVRDAEGGGRTSAFSGQVYLEGFKVYNIGNASANPVPQP